MSDCIVSSVTISDYIEIASIVINVIFGVWVIITIQKNLNNRRILKDHFIAEIKDIRNEYRDFLVSLSSNRIKPKQVAPWFKLMNIKVTNLVGILNNKYNLDNKVLYPYQVELRETVTEFEEYINNFKTNTEIKLNDESMGKIINFQQTNNGIFNKIIIHINDR